MQKIWANSGDSHLVEPDDLFTTSLPEALADRMPRSVKDDDGRTTAPAAPQSDTRPAAPAEPTALPPVTHSANGTTSDVAGTAPQPADPARPHTDR